MEAGWLEALPEGSMPGLLGLAGEVWLCHLNFPMTEPLKIISRLPFPGRSGQIPAMTRSLPPAAMAELRRTDQRGDSSFMFGRTAYLPAGWYGPRRRSHFFLLVMLQGSVEIESGGDSFRVEPGSGILRHSGVVDFYRFSRTAPSLHTWCEVNASVPSREERQLLRAVSGPFPVAPALHVLINEGLAAPLNAGPELRIAARSLALSCLLRFAAEAREVANRPGPQHGALERALNLLASNPAPFRTAADLASQCGISLSRLRQLFRDAGGESPSAMLWRLKTEHAVQVIRSTGLTLAEVADQCGFGNPFHLSRCVKARTGFSPSQLREREWQR